MSDRPLTAIVDGRQLPSDEAKLLWRRFSAHMDEHEGDFEGFARQEGFTSARVDVVEGAPTLSLSSEAQAAAPKPARGKRQRKGKRRRRRRKG